MKRDFYNTDITVIDLKSLAAEFSAKFGEPVKISSYGGMIRQPKLGLLDRWNIVLQEPIDGMFTLEIDKDVPDMALGLGADWMVKVRIADLERHLGETIPIAEYLSEMLGAGSRRVRNELDITAWLNEPEQSEKPQGV